MDTAGPDGALPRHDPGIVRRRRAAGAAARLLRRPLERLLACVQAGAVRVRLPDGSELAGQGAQPGPVALLSIHRWRALARLAMQGDIGLAEAYRDGDWSTPDLLGLLEFGMRNEAGWSGALDAAGPLRALSRVANLVRTNTRRRSRRNVAAHYDLGNDFYRLWLDADLIYSSGIYEDSGDTLEAAQAAKVERVIERLDLPAGPPGVEVLEVGCGWGALACTLARRHGARVTGITLSPAQLAHALERAARDGVAARARFALQDYREVRGQFDRIVSIEMIEAVGEKHWPRYFRALHDGLRPRGLAVVQAITIGAGYFEHYRRHGDFIQRLIFPGGMLPSEPALRRHAREAGLRLVQAENFGASYARTLAAWQRRFQQAWPQIARQGFDARFKRLWEYYLDYCQAGFRAGRVDVGLYTFARAAA